MILAYHLILSTYGFWLPNDSRGSWSDFVGAWELFRYGGPATKVFDRRSYAHDPHDATQRRAVKQHLKYPPVRLTRPQADSVSRGFVLAIKEGGYPCHACAILHDHAHLVLGRSSRPIERISGHLKSSAARQLTEDGLHPFQKVQLPDGRRPSLWGEGSWRVFIDNTDHLHAAIRYVEQNPLKERMSSQRWPFVVPTEHGSQASRLNGEARRG
jgi:hypothetical protein